MMGMMCPMTLMMQACMGRVGLDPGELMGDGKMSALFGSRATPAADLSVDDVRGYLGRRLERLKNRRLKVGTVSMEGETIVAEIVTLENSLVQRMKVDRRTGKIDYQAEE